MADDTALTLDTVPWREGVYGDRVLRIEPGGIGVIAGAERHGSPHTLLWVWAAPNLEFATLYVGVLPIALFGGGLWLTLAGLFIGTLIGSVWHGIVSTDGPRYGIAQLVASRGAFGYRGNRLPALLNALTGGIGWVAVNTVSATFAVQSLWHLVSGRSPGFVGVLIGVFAAEIAVAGFGYNMVHRLATLLAPLLALVFLLCSAVIAVHARAQGFEPGAPLAAGGPVAAFILAVFVALAYAASWNPYASDYSRYLPAAASPRRVALCAGAGLFLSCFWLEAAGALLATVPGTLWSASASPTDQLIGVVPRALGVAALIAIACGAAIANVLNVYSAAMSLLAAGGWHGRFIRAGLIVLFGAVSFLIARGGAAGPGGQYENFLLLTTYWIVPWVAVIITDRAVNRGHALAEFFSPGHRSAAGVIAMVTAIAASVPFWNQAVYVGWVAAAVPQTGDLSFVVEFVVAALVYAALAARRRRHLVGTAAGVGAGQPIPPRHALR